MAVDLTARHALTPMGVDVSEVHTTAEHALGTMVCGNLGCEWIYAQANGAITGDGYVVTVDDDFQAVMATNTASAGGEWAGVVQVAVADNEYCWVQISGPCNVRGAANCAAGALVTTTTTAGTVDDAAGTGTKTITGMYLHTAVGGSAANAVAYLHRAHVTVTN